MMRAAGVPEAVCMQISGHLTASIFRRYAITNTSETSQALQTTGG
jgi:hypothetical protein